MPQFEFEERLEDLSSAEDFLNFFDIQFEPSIVHINRLHIMQRFHDYLSKAEDSINSSGSEEEVKDIYQLLLTQAYQDFVDSDAKTEKVLKVFKMQEPQTSFVPIDQILGQ